MVRAAAKNHACVTIVTDPVAVRAVARRAPTPTTTPSATTPAARSRRGVRAHRRVRRADRGAGCRRRRAVSRSTSTSRSNAPARRCATARTRTSRRRATASRAPRAGGTRSRSTAASRCRYLNLYDADAAWRLVHDLGRPSPAVRDHQARQPVRRRGRRRPRRRVPARARVRRALGVRRHRRAQPADRRRHRRAHGRGPAGRRRDRARLRAGRDRRADREAQEHAPARSAAPPEAAGLDFRQITGGFLVQDAHHFAATRDDWRVVTKRAPTDDRVARRRAGVAHLRSREVERDRAREGRPGGRHRRRPAEPGRVGRDRGQEGGRPRRGRRVPRRTRSTRSPTASRPRPRPGVAVVVQPGGAMRDEPTSNGPTSSASPWSSPASATSSTEPGLHEEKLHGREDDARWSGRRRGVRRPRAAHREARRQRAHAGSRHHPRRRRRRRARATSA